MYKCKWNTNTSAFQFIYAATIFLAFVASSGFAYPEPEPVANPGGGYGGGHGGHGGHGGGHGPAYYSYNYKVGYESMQLLVNYSKLCIIIYL